MTFLSMSNVEVFYDQLQAIKNVSLEIKQGEIVYLIGRNGAGKSSLLKSIMGLAPVRSGNIQFKDTNITNKKTHSIVRMGIGFIPENRGIFPELTVNSHLETFGNNNSPKWNKENIYNLFPPLKKLEKRLAGALSGGEQQMLSIARALTLEPELLLLDEPLEGLSPVIIKNFSEVFRLLKGQITMVIAEQKVKGIEELIDKVYELERGQIKVQN